MWTKWTNGLNPRWTAVSVFSGAGGLDLGFASRFKILLACELDPYAAASYAANSGFKLVTDPDQVDVGTVYQGDAVCLRPPAGLEADLLVCGPPCQDFSVLLGPKAPGLQGPRGRLVLAVPDIARRFNVRLVVLENVPHLRRWFKGVLEAFTAAGYGLIWSGVLRACDYGAPQARSRLFAIFARDLDPLAAAVLGHEVADFLRVRSHPFNPFYLTPLEVFAGKPLPECQVEYEGVLDDYGLDWPRDVVRAYTALVGAGAGLEAAFEAHRKLLAELGYLGRPVERAPDASDVAGRPWADVLPGEGARAQGRVFSGIYYRRLHPLKPAGTVTARGGGGTTPYHYRRLLGRLTLEEMARLQTFKDGYIFMGPARARRAQIGDAVPPVLAKAVADVCAALLDTIGR